MTGAEMDDLYELYLLGALEPELAAEVESYLRENPAEAAERMRDAEQLVAAMAGMAEQVTPPAALRARVLAAVTPPRRTSRNWFFAFGALAAACLVLALYSVASRNELQQARDQLQTAGKSSQAQVAALTNERDQLRQQLTNTNRTSQAQVAALSGERDQLRSTLESANSRNQTQLAALTSEIAQLRTALARANAENRTQLASLTGEVNQLQTAFAIIRRPDTRSTRFGEPAATHGWVFANREGGFVFVGSQLPNVAADRTLELWLVPKSGAPRPAGLFRPTDTAGDTVHVATGPVNLSELKALAVSDEPRAGSTAPTTKPFLLVPLSE